MSFLFDNSETSRSMALSFSRASRLPNAKQSISSEIFTKYFSCSSNNKFVLAIDFNNSFDCFPSIFSSYSPHALTGEATREQYHSKEKEDSLIELEREAAQGRTGRLFFGRDGEGDNSHASIIRQDKSAFNTFVNPDQKSQRT